MEMGGRNRGEGARSRSAAMIHASSFPLALEAWKEMEKLKDAGIAKTIGVSNWLAQDIKEVVDSHPQHPIEVNQIEFVSTPHIQRHICAV